MSPLQIALAIIAGWLALGIIIAWVLGGIVRRGRRDRTDPPTRSPDDWWQITDRPARKRP